MAMCRGIGTRNLRAFVIERHGADGWERVTASLSPADREALAAVTDAHWADAALGDRVTRAACDVLGGGSLFLAACAGRASAERNASGSMRWFHHLIDPGFAIRNMTIYWRREQDGGHFEVQLLEDRVIATLHEWTQDRACCESLLHYLGRTLEFFGSVSSLEHPRCRSQGDPCCEFRARFRLGEVKAPPLTLQSLPDALAALREIASTGDADLVRTAIARLFGRFLGARQVKLSLAGDGAASPPPPGARGEPRLRRFVLEHAGAIVGLLELEPPEDAASEAMIAEVVPWLGLVLGRTSPSVSAPPPPPAGIRDVEGRLREASDSFRLTRRELDVLRLVAQGRSNKETAGELGITEATVEVHVSSILRKYGVDGRGALIARFWRTH